MSRPSDTYRAHLDDYGDVMTVPEVAEFLRVDKRAIYAAIRQGQLPAIRVGRLLRVHRERLAAQLAGGD